MKQQDHSYQSKLFQFAQELEGVSQRKSQAKELLYDSSLKLKTTLEALNDIMNLNTQQ